MQAPRILVVEDERIIALHLRQQLTKLGYDVPNTVSTGDHALRRIEEAPPDLVLMDINLQGKLDGIETAAAIPPAYGIPIIYLTAYSTDETLARAAATNPHGYILKPFSERELHAMIQMALARCRRERLSRSEVERGQQVRKMDALQRLAAGVAGEVDDLLTVLYDHLEVMGEHAIRIPGLAGIIQYTFDAAIEKERLVSCLLEFAGRRRVTRERISVADLVRQNLGRIHQIAGHAVEVRLQMPNDLWPAWIDPDRLLRSLVNLVTNARQAMQAGGRLTIAARNSVIEQDGASHYVQLSVADTGTGMPNAILERAFEPFFTTRTDSAGPGLGLSLVFSFIRQSGGHVSIESRPGGGTSVRLYLPAATGQPVTIPLPAAAAADHYIVIDSVSDQLPRAAGDIVADAPARGNPVRYEAGWAQPTVPGATVLWQKTADTLYASVANAPDQPHYRLIVEPMPRQTAWDWTVWRAGAASALSRCGRASSILCAMAAAEDAARQWEAPSAGA